MTTHAFRFSLVSPRSIPGALVAHVDRELHDNADDIARSTVVADGLDALTWTFSSDAALNHLRLNLRGPAMALGVDSALLVDDLARFGPRLIVTDVDSTLITQEVIELLAAHAGVADEVREITESAMRGELDFAQSLHHRVATLRGLPTSVIDSVANAVVLSPGAENLVRVAHAHGARVGIVSGGFTPVVERIAAHLSIDFYRANGLQIVDGELTGRTEGPIIDAAAKRLALAEWCAQLGIDSHLAVAVGDGANDLEMIGAAGLGVGYLPKDIVRERADASITHARLDAVLALLGWDAVSR